MDAGVIAVLALVVFAGAILRAAWLVFKAHVLDKAAPRIYYGQPHTLLICKRRIERTSTHDGYGNHTFVEAVYEEADPDLIEVKELPQLTSPRKQLTRR